ncbi:MAG: GNAT family acetyltransferase [Mogibacterium sp.]|nr:GNAT family acetyltransferase [Mogibacterium sp.]
MTIRNATAEDIEGVKALLRRYHRDTISDEDRPDGFVTTAITDKQLGDLIEKENGVMIIAEPSDAAGEPDRVLGFCFAAPWEFWEPWPLFRHMMDIIPDYEFEGKKLVLEETYQYGPMCVDRSIRRTGAFEDLFFASLKQFRDRFPIMLTFVNQINKRSENAHTNKAHMTTIGTFDFGDNHYYLMGIRTDHGR